MEYKAYTLELPETFSPKRGCYFKLRWRDKKYCIYARYLRNEQCPHDFYVMEVEVDEWLDGTPCETINIRHGYKVAQTYKLAVEKLSKIRILDQGNLYLK